MFEVDLDRILARKKLNRTDLNRKIGLKYLNKIALKITDWKTCVILLGITQQAIDDIETEQSKVRHRRLLSLQTWHSKNGEDATYIKLADALVQLERVDLVQELIDVYICQMSNTRDWVALYNTTRYKLKELCKVIYSMLLRRSKFVFIVVAVTSLLIVISNPYETHENKPVLKTSQFSSKDADLATWMSINKTKCGSVSYDLPLSSGPFVGRNKEILEMIQLMNVVHIVSINGAPGFGKSLLAINVGYEMLRQGTTVRYIDAMDKLSHLVIFANTEDYNAKATRSYVHKPKFSQASQSKSLSTGSKSHLVVKSDHPFHTKLPPDRVLDSLLRWSREIDCHTLLILDNCDDLIHSETPRERFIRLLRAMVENSRDNLHIVITSRQQILILDDFESLVIKELSESASVELLSHLAPGISKAHSELVASLVEGCPLALKVVGKLLHKQEDMLTKKLEEELLNQPIRVLDKASIQKERFSVIMDVVYEQLSGKMQECGYYLSLFPGSFEHEAGSVILPESLTSQGCLEYFVEQSLLDRYSVAYLTHYKMHRLIREYFKHRGSLSTLSHYFNLDFEKSYCRYFTKFVLNYAKIVMLDNVTERDQYQYSFEIHNIYHVLNLLLSKTEPHLTKELIVLAYAVGEEFISANAIKSYFPSLVAKVNATCYYLKPEKCGELFSLIITQLYNECKCDSVKEFIFQVLSSTCKDIFQCESIAEIQQHPSIFTRLDHFEWNFLFRLRTFHCEATTDSTLITLYLPFTNSFLPFAHILMMIYFNFLIIITGYADPMIKSPHVVLLHIVLLLSQIYPLLSFHYQLDFMIWMNLIFPQFFTNFIRFLVSLALFVILQVSKRSGHLLIHDYSQNNLLFSKKYIFILVTVVTFCAVFEFFVYWRFIPFCY